MAVEDIKDCILCACDAIVDGGFQLREVPGDDSVEARLFSYEELGKLQDGGTYMLEACEQETCQAELERITGDRMRRLTKPVEPLKHVESQKALEKMKRGSNLLKHTRYGFPHLRQFQLSDDMKRLVWYSGAKSKDETVVRLDEMKDICIGQAREKNWPLRRQLLELTAALSSRQAPALCDQ